MRGTDHAIESIIDANRRKWLEQGSNSNLPNARRVSNVYTSSSLERYLTEDAADFLSDT
jgi:hypothetical protein